MMDFNLYWRSLRTKHEGRDFQSLYLQEVKHPVNGTWYLKSGLHFVWSRNCINNKRAWTKQHYFSTGIWSTKGMETFFNKHKCNIYCNLLKLNLKYFIPKCCLSQYYTRCSVSLCYKDNKMPFSCIQILWRPSGGYVTLSSYVTLRYFVVLYYNVSIISTILVILRIVHKCVLSVKSK